MKTFNQITLTGLLIILCACMNENRPVPTPYPTPLVIFTLPPTSTHPPSFDLPLTMTAIYQELDKERLPPEIQAEIIDLWQNNANCKLPCYWGITPGVTTWQDAQAFLEHLADRLYKDDKYTDGGYAQYYADFSIVDNNRMGIGTHLIVSADKTVERIYFQAYDNNDVYFKKYLYKYSLDEIFKVMGKPDKIYVSFVAHSADMGYGFLVLYNKEKTFFDYGLYPDATNRICPNFLYSDRIDQLNFSLSHLGNDLNILPEERENPESDPSYWRPIQKEFGISEKQFYNQILTNPSSCFELLSEKQ